MIDAMRYTKDLVESGFTKDQADTSLKVFEEIMNQNFATKKDIQLSELALRSDLKESEMHIRSEMKEIEFNLRSEIKDVSVLINTVHDKIILKLGSLIVISTLIALQKLI
jgi:hypothetical protein